MSNDAAEKRLERRRLIWHLFEDQCEENAAPWASQMARYSRYLVTDREAAGVMIAGRAYMWSIIDRIAESLLDPDEESGWVAIRDRLRRFMRAAWTERQTNPNWYPDIDDFYEEIEDSEEAFNTF